jgi:hypothetical protein
MQSECCSSLPHPDQLAQFGPFELAGIIILICLALKLHFHQKHCFKLRNKANSLLGFQLLTAAGNDLLLCHFQQL